MRSQLLPDADIGEAGLRSIYGKIDLGAGDPEPLPPWVFESIFAVITGGPGRPHVGVPGATAYLAGSRHRPPITLPPTAGCVACIR
ncbi:hypothetical protein [Mycolicibacterium sp.]|uniref:hypothetical protein n=1 Tax=Mycolicibacterium sp. TaxID=2320850 RepID=UPI003D14EE77